MLKVKPSVERLESRELPGSLGDLSYLASSLGVTEEHLLDTLTMRVPVWDDPSFHGQVPAWGDLQLPLMPQHFNPDNAIWSWNQPFAYGAPGWKSVVGDWNGDHEDTIGVVDPQTMTWYLKNDNHAGEPSVAPFAFGQPGDRPISGDWDNTGWDKIGVQRPSNGLLYLALPGEVRITQHWNV